MGMDLSPRISLLDLHSPEAGLFIIQEDILLYLDSANLRVFFINGEGQELVRMAKK